MIIFFRKNFFLFTLGFAMETFYLIIIILEKIYPFLIKKQALIYSCFIFSSLFFLIILKRPPIPDNKKTLKIIIFFLFIFSVTLLFSFPLGPGDIYNYLYYAKVFTYYHQNPFLIAPINFPTDPLANYVSTLAKKTPSIYGPLWMIISFFPLFIGSNNIFISLLALKILSIIFNFGCFFVIFKIISLLNFNDKNLILLAYAWNPLILFEGINDGHNDIIMIFFVLLAIYFLLKKYNNLVLPVLILSILTKYVTILLFPLFFVFLIKKNTNFKQRLKFILKQFIILSVLTIILFSPFWQGFSTLKGLYSQASIVSIRHLSLVPYLISLFSRNVLLIRYISYISFILIYFAIIFYSFKKVASEQKLIKASFWILASYLFFASLWFQAWYLVWLIPLGIIIGERKYFTGIIFLSVFGIIHQGYNLFFLIQSFFKSSFLE